MIKRSFDILLLLAAFSLILVSCDKKRLSYVDIVKKENKNIDEFMSKNAYKVGKMPSMGESSPEKIFFIPTEGIWMRILDWGDTNDMAISGKTRVITRMRVIRFTQKGKNNAPLDCISPKDAAGKMPPVFIYNENKQIQEAPNSPGSNFSMLLTPSMQYALEYVGNGGVVQMIVSFKKGPIAQEIKSKGEPLFYEKVSFSFEK